MQIRFLCGAALGLALQASLAADFQPAPQQFRQEIARHFTGNDGAPTGSVTLVDCPVGGAVRALAAGQWYELQNGQWHPNPALKPATDAQFTFADSKGLPGASAGVVAGSPATPPLGQD